MNLEGLSTGRPQSHADQTSGDLLEWKKNELKDHLNNSNVLYFKTVFSFCLKSVKMTLLISS